MIRTYHQYYPGDKMKNEMGGAYSKYEEERGRAGFSLGNREGKRPFG